MQLSMFSSEEPPASPTASPDSEQDWMIRVATSCSPLLQLLADIGPRGWFGRTSPVSFQVKEAPILEAFWGYSADKKSKSPSTGGETAESYRASRALTASHGECLTLSSSEYPSVGVACSLSDVLETGDLPPQYYLSARACEGILRRAEKRGKALPQALQQALQMAAQRTAPAAEAPRKEISSSM